MNSNKNSSVSGQFINHKGERFYLIENIDKIPPFFIVLVSSSDHWLFISSNGGLTAGRVCPEFCLFPYVPVDKIHDSLTHTGSKTILHVNNGHQVNTWEPWIAVNDNRYSIKRNLYKNVLGNKLCFEEINDSLELVFRYSWTSSNTYGFIRECELINLSKNQVDIDILDGLQNILPAGTPQAIQASASNLVDAYKWSEIDKASGIALFTIYSGITDKPEPFASMRANTVFCLGFEPSKTLLSSQQINDFYLRKPLHNQTHTRGARGAYLVNSTFKLAAKTDKTWQFVCDVEKSKYDILSLHKTLSESQNMRELINQSIRDDSNELRRIISTMDGFQLTNEELVSTHHYANVLFNGMRGGIFDKQYWIPTKDFTASVRHFNRPVYQAHEAFLNGLVKQLKFPELLELIKQQNDANLTRLCYEFLPITFGRRHGDPSRPWNDFCIKLKDDNGKRLLNYQGNWRDIFQNWEALLFSYPEFIESVIAKFVNASTIDGYNPYRISQTGIDWETEDPKDPWSHIGYWGDHQIIYLLKLLELSNNFHPNKIRQLLHEPIFCYANVPYRIKSHKDLLNNPKDTIEYDYQVAQKIEQGVQKLGTDAKLLLNEAGEVYLVNLSEKLLVPLLAKLSNFVLGGGIWLNTQRPEWNDANNALAGQGLSMVTLYYLRRYVCFLKTLFKDQNSISLSKEVALWLDNVITQFQPNRSTQFQTMSAQERFDHLEKLACCAYEYRKEVYQQGFSGVTDYNIKTINTFLSNTLSAINHSIDANKRTDGLYHAYNLMDSNQDSIQINHLQLMLEGQVAILSSGGVGPEQAIDMLNTLFDSNLYRSDQQSFMLYPDNELPNFLTKNRISPEQITNVPKLEQLLEQSGHALLICDVDGYWHFNADLINHEALVARLNALETDYGSAVTKLKQPINALYEMAFNHKKFTGRSGGMFGFEGLGSIYWHMVAKLLLAVQEIYFNALDTNCNQATCHHLGQLYYRVRQGIGFNKTPTQYGAFPTDPYSHTPKHTGAQQPGMTGQVKEEVLTRFGELGIRICHAKVHFQPNLLRIGEFTNTPKVFNYLDILGNERCLTMPSNAIAFTWIGLPILYVLSNTNTEASLNIHWRNQKDEVLTDLILSEEISCKIFMRSDEIAQITLKLNANLLFDE